ncbi:MAG: macro domain-containing protein [Halobacteriales archaeon]
MDFRVIRDDTATQSGDALVNAAGTSLRMDTGVAGSLRRVGEEALAEAGPVELGGVVVTVAFDLDATHVIHAAAMAHYGDGRTTKERVRTAARNALESADGRGCRSPVMPVLGIKAAGLPFDVGPGPSARWCSTTHRPPSRAVAPPPSRSARRPSPPWGPARRGGARGRPR